MDNRQDRNWGSQASTKMLVKLLKEKHPYAEIRGVRRQMAGRRGYYRRVGERFLPKAMLTDNWTSIGARIGLRAVTSGWRELLDWPDLIVVNGEGTLHSQCQVLRWMPLIAYIRRQSKAQLWIVNSSFQIEDPSHHSLFKRCLSQADRIVVREERSAEVARGLGLNPISGADCAFLLRPDTGSGVDELLAKLNIRGAFAVMTGSAVAWKWQPEPGRKMIQALKRQGLEVVFTSSEASDADFARLLCPDMLLVTEADLRVEELMQLQARATVLIGGRFHPTIFAATMGVPFVAFESNTHKMEGLMSQLATSELLVAYDDVDASIEALNVVLSNRERYRHHLSDRCAKFRQLAYQNVMLGEDYTEMTKEDPVQPMAGPDLFQVEVL
jgi:polysaccharide pyruvyl transferase WcaK-like protein